MKRLICTVALALTIVMARGADQVLISEFLTKNVTSIEDEDGSHEDWIEILNAGTNTVDLGGWYLTDNATRLNKWTFPSTALAPGRTLIVWASNKNRRTAGAPLHTNFKLDPAPPEFLALVRPDFTIASQYAPTYPSQAQDISYGLPMTAATNTILSAGAAAKFLVPGSLAAEAQWNDPALDDSSWSNATIGLGFSTDANAGPTWVLAADSLLEFSGQQGASGWFYGYYNKTADTVTPGYQTNDFTAFPNTGSGFSSGNYFTGTLWDWYNGNPPWDNIGSNIWHPNGTNNSNEHWVIRRWVAQTNGLLRVDWSLAKQNTGGGNGVSGFVLHNGAPLDTAIIGGTDAVGVNRTLYLSNVAVGDKIDFALSSAGTDGLPVDSSDGSYGQMRVFRAAYLTNFIATDIGSTMANSNASAYLRVPFTVADPSQLTGLLLKVKYNDGFVAFLNGQEVARRNAPSYAAGGVIGNSTNDWSASGAQGNGGWFYGYYNQSLDTNGLYEAGDFNMLDGTWRFDGTNWALSPDDPPFTMIGQTSWTPNGATGLYNHWAIRRWVSEVSGVVTARVSFAKSISGGNGATLRVFLNGTPITARTIPGNDLSGITTNILLAGLDAGDAVDFALDPLGTDATYNDALDRCTFGVVLTQAPSSDLAWNSAATGAATVDESMFGQTLDISAYRSFLHAGANLLAIQAMNLSATNADFFILPELAGVVQSINTSQPVYFLAPTPNAMNGTGTTNLGPLLVDLAFAPLEPASSEAITVTARAVATFNAVSNLTLTYRVMYGGEVTNSMYDDGLHGDGTAGDGVYGARIPAGVATAGQMVRWFLRSTDTASNTMRWPANPTTRSPQYFGTVIADPALVTKLPVLHWFVSNPSGANSDAGTTCSIYFNGQFVDNIGVTLHGQSSSGFPKRSHNFNLNPGYKLTISPDKPRIGDFALLTTWADRSHMRNMLAADTYAMSGTPFHYSFALRVQQNAAFFSLANFMEQGNEDFLQRLGFDQNGALYKIYNTLTTVTSNEKKTREWEPPYDLQALINAVTQPDVNARVAYVFDNVNVPEVVSFLASKAINSDHDCCHKNHYLYRDSEGTGEWFALPWDVDLSFGHVWTSANGNYFDDTIYTNVAPYIGGNQSLFGVLYNDPVLKSMITRRVRTLADEILQPPGTATNTDLLRGLISYYEDLVRDDAGLDQAKWGTRAWNAALSGPGNPTSSFTNEIGRMKDYFLPGRRAWIFNYCTSNSYAIPAAQPTNAAIQFGAIEHNPASSNQAQEYIELFNPNGYAVDLSGWKLAGGVRFTFAPGTVITPANRLYVSPDVKAFRGRTAGPRAGQKLMVVGPYQGQLSAWGETLALLTPDGRTNSATGYTGTPSLAQQYLRVTEIMYHPPAFGGFTNQDLEYIELKNISTNVTLDLNGVKFVNGIEFAFTGSTITNLAPGERVLVVKNGFAFSLRYVSSGNIAGQFTGSLENAGERLQLLDAANEEILDFSYNNAWYPLTDGLGFSLVVVDELADHLAWDQKATWRASGQIGGSPGIDDPAPPVFLPVLVNEVFAAPIPPALDAIELFNPNATAVDIGDWYLTDNFYLPTKYRLPVGTTIPAGGYLVLDETQLNPSGFGFSFSSFGEEAYLFSGDASGNLSGYYHGFEFGASEFDVSFGRHANTMGEADFVAQSAVTLTNANAGPRVGPVVISEIMYHPASLTTNDPPASFVELRNLTATNVPLYNTAEPTNTWRLRGGVDFDFPTNVTLPPGGSVLVVGFNPTGEPANLAAFRSRYGLSSNVAICGPWLGKLANDQDTVELNRPALTTTNGVPRILVEKVHYRSTAPWPVLADGWGGSLTRVVAGSYGNEPTNWVAAYPSPGTNLPSGQAPLITAQPQGGAAAAGSNVTLSVAVSGTGPFYFQWTANGISSAVTTNSALTIANVQPQHTGLYQVLVMTPNGSALSEPASLLVLAPVRITSQPQSVIGFPGQTATFSVGISGDAPAYQWLMNGTNLPGADGPTLARANLTADDAGTFTVIVTNLVSSVVSTPATLSVLFQPLITQQPQGLAVFATSNALFSVMATSSTTLRYQWYFNATNLLADRTNNPLLLTNCQAANAGLYSVTVSDDYGVTPSSVAALEVQTKPYYTSQPTPSNVVALVGAPVSFRITAGGALPMTYRWRKGISVLTNMVLYDTNSMLSLPAVQHSQASYYDVASITNLFGSTTNVSPRAYLTVMDPLTNQAVRAGSNATFSILASTYMPPSTVAGFANLMLRYQWWFNGTNFLASGSNGITSTNLTFTITNAQLANEGTYTVVATNPVGTVLTQSAQLSILRPPSITNQPVGGSVTAGDSFTFTVGAEGSPPLRFQWRRNGSDLAAADGASLTLANAQIGDAGGYSVVVANSEGSVTSEVATLSIAAPPSVVQSPTNQSVVVSSNVTLSVLAEGSGPLSHQWFFNQTNLLLGATEPQLLLTNVQPTNAGAYHVVVTNLFGAATSAVAVLTVLEPPRITTQPTNVTVAAGATAEFSVAAEGTSPLAYQWWFNQTNALSGATQPTLTISNAATPQAGGYQVVVSNLAGSVTSVVAMLTVTVLTPPHIDGITPPANPGDPVALSFLGLAGQSFTVLYRGTLDSGSWQRLTNIPPLAAGQTVTAQDHSAAGQPQRFYRIVTPMQTGP
ncbi:MAG: immunoglobulin domain-containing protein [Verrucomicrobia bacterium]|nr:immunoglobulin domain-containing protein [Verrucomicrobiota bacterium]